jgi:MFS family permease
METTLERNETFERGKILILAALTNALVAAAPAMCMPVLFNEISADLNLSLVQLGLLWGIGGLPGLVTGLLGGVIGDRIGPKRVLIAGCLLAGMFGIFRGLATGFWTMAAAMILMGVVTPLIPLNTLKTCGTWFSRRQLGMASGVLSMAMALGFLIGSMLSATVLSPWLGGWRQVLYLYGGIAILLSVPWYFTRPLPANAGSPIRPGSLRESIGNVIRIRKIWLLGLALLGFSGCIQGTLGYLPLHLRNLGWAGVHADGALAAFHTISMLFTIPIALGSDKLGMRKQVLVAAAVMVIIGVGLLSVADGLLVWIAVCLAGFVRDGFMAVFMTSVIETEGVGARFAGTATGVTMLISGMGNILAPPIGNSLAGVSPGLPFAFWAALAAGGLLILFLVKENRLVFAEANPTL